MDKKNKKVKKFKSKFSGQPNPVGNQTPRFGCPLNSIIGFGGKPNLVAGFCFSLYPVLNFFYFFYFFYKLVISINTKMIFFYDSRVN